jgi:UPF0271 protein
MNQTPCVDLNADVGESFGAQRPGDDEPMFAYVTSGSVACGFHAGNPITIAATIQAAVKAGVSIGAHPSYPDASDFGRRSMTMAPGELASAVLYQIGAVAAIAREFGIALAHVKPHGALYNDSARDAQLAETIAQAVAGFDRNLILVGLAGSHSLAAAKEQGLRTAAEAFCDRVYEPDGTLRGRTLANSLLENPHDCAEQALEIVKHRRVRASDGQFVAVGAQTLCIHGDSPRAANIAGAVRSALLEAGVRIAPLGQFV